MAVNRPASVTGPRSFAPEGTPSPGNAHGPRILTGHSPSGSRPPSGRAERQRGQAADAAHAGAEPSAHLGAGGAAARGRVVEVAERDHLGPGDLRDRARVPL